MRIALKKLFKTLNEVVDQLTREILPFVINNPLLFLKSLVTRNKLGAGVNLPNDKN